MNYTVVTLSERHSRLMQQEINCVLGTNTASMTWGDLSSILNERGQQAGDVLITPGNSYGDMSGGFDLAVRKYYGFNMEAAVQNEITGTYRGELLVGSAFVIPVRQFRRELGYGAFHCLAYAPTMRVPKRLHAESDAVYSSVLAALQAIHRWNNAAMTNGYAPHLDHVWLTCHGVGTGGLPIEYVAKQTAMAIFQFENNSILGQFDTQAWDREIHRGQ